MLTSSLELTDSKGDRFKGFKQMSLSQIKTLKIEYLSF